MEFPDVTVAYHHVDAATIYLVTDPGRFDVIVTDNLFGDIITDLAAAVAGGIGLAASGNLDVSAAPTRACSSRCTARRRTSPARARPTRPRRCCRSRCCSTTSASPRRPPGGGRGRRRPGHPRPAAARRDHGRSATGSRLASG